ncbi:MAG: ABC transporter permease subunit [Prosthecobacter sp.]|nr:ABC transporter permease subunit [Prosthecobacter sp.]
MRIFWVLLKKELRGFFVSPMAYIVLALVMVLNGFSFRAALSVLESAPSEGSIVTWTFHAMWFWLSYFFVFPLLTMRLFAEEKKMGTLETLFTAPVRTWQVIWAKYLAAMVIYCVLWVPSYFNFVLVDWITVGQVEIPPGALKGSYLILFAMGLFNMAIGCFASALTSNQIIAAVIAFTISLLHFLMGLFIMVVGKKVSDTFLDIINYFASMEHIRTFTSGLIDTRPLVYYTSFALLFLALTHQVVEFRRWRP